MLADLMKEGLGDHILLLRLYQARHAAAPQLKRCRALQMLRCASMVPQELPVGPSVLPPQLERGPSAMRRRIMSRVCLSFSAKRSSSSSCLRHGSGQAFHSPGRGSWAWTRAACASRVTLGDSWSPSSVQTARDCCAVKARLAADGKTQLAAGNPAIQQCAPGPIDDCLTQRHLNQHLKLQKQLSGNSGAWHETAVGTRVVMLRAKLGCGQPAGNSHDQLATA